MAWHEEGEMTPEGLRAEFEQALPLGTSAEQVTAYLDSHQMEHSDLNAQDHTIAAIVRDVERGVLTRKSLSAVFKFDTSGRLARIDVKASFTGP